MFRLSLNFLLPFVSLFSAFFTRLDKFIYYIIQKKKQDSSLQLQHFTKSYTCLNTWTFLCFTTLPKQASTISTTTMSGPFQTSALPMAVPSKATQYPTYSQYSGSPPECEETMSAASGVPSGYSATSAGYVGSSSGDYESTGSASGVDFQEYMQDRFSNSFDPIPLDRSMAVQAQT